MSEKDKKKALKAKAKAAAAEAAKKEEEAAAGGEAEKKQEKKETKEETSPPKTDAAEKAKIEPEKVVKAQVSSEAPAAPAASTPPENAAATPPTEYSTPEITRDAAKHKAGLNDPGRPSWQNPLHHNNPDMQKIFREDFDSEEEFQKAIQPAPPVAPSSDDPEADHNKVVAPEYLNEIANEMVNLTVLEMNELVNKLADHYGFHEGMLSRDDADDGSEDVGGDDADAAGGAAAAPVAEKTVFDVKLVAFDAANKIKVIKEVRAISGLGLKEAKELVEGAPKVLSKDIKKEQAEEIKAKLEAVGATVEIV